MENKVADLTTAIRENVRRGDALFLSGMQHGEPTAAIFEILRQGIADLQLIPQLPTAGELLLSEGRVGRLFTAFTSSLDVRRGPLAQRRLNRAPAELVEFSHGALHLALLAAQQGIPFSVTRALIGSDYLAVNEAYFASIESPFDESLAVAVRALQPDVAIIHVQEADVLGNARKRGSLGMDVAGTHAAKRLVVTCERLIDTAEFQREPNLTTIPGFLVDAVVEAPLGAWPEHLNGEYADDLRHWFSVMSTDDGYDHFLDELVYGSGSHGEFVAKLISWRGEGYIGRLRDAAAHPNAELLTRLGGRG